MTEVTFIGTGARWPAELAKLGHPANALYDSVRDVVKGVSCGCAAVFGATEGVESTGNIAVNDRVSLFLMDYPRRERLKILGHARVADASSELVEQLVEPNAGPSVERLFFIDVISFDWNCPNISLLAIPPLKLKR